MSGLGARSEGEVHQRITTAKILLCLPSLESESQPRSDSAYTETCGDMWTYAK